MLFNQCVFKIQTVGLTVKMDALMYMHHSGQFFDTDNIGTKVLITTNETIFLDVQFYVSAYLLTYFSNVIKKSKNYIFM